MSHSVFFTYGSPENIYKLRNGVILPFFICKLNLSFCLHYHCYISNIVFPIVSVFWDSPALQKHWRFNYPPSLPNALSQAYTLCPGNANFMHSKHIINTPWKLQCIFWQISFIFLTPLPLLTWLVVGSPKLF